MSNKTPFAAFGSKPPEVPLPNDIPKKMDLSHLPENILRSRTMDSLSEQNEDMHARLNISLKRIAKLEDHLSNANQHNEKLRYQYDTLNDQVLILKEKTLALVERRGLSSSKIQKTKDELKMAQMRYSELNEVSEKNEILLQKTKESFTKKIKQLLRHRSMLQKIARVLKKDKDHFSAQISQQNQIVSDLKKKLGESTEYIQNQEKVFVENNRHEIDNLKTKLYSLESSLKQKDHQLNHNMKDGKKAIEDFKTQSLGFQEMMSKRSAEDEKIIDSLRKELKIADQDVKAAVAREQLILNENNKLKELSSDLEANLETEIKKFQLTKSANEGLRTQLQDKENQASHLAKNVNSLKGATSEDRLLRSELYTKVESLQKLNKQLSMQLNILSVENKSYKDKMGQLEQFKRNHQNYSLNNFQDKKEYSSNIDSLITDIQMGNKKLDN